MSVEKHPDYQEELERLEMTKAYIGEVLEDSVTNKEGFQENMKQAMVDLDYLDSSLSYVNILTNARLLEMTNRDFRNLAKIQNKPYFSRIDFKPDGADSIEKLYIGKTSLYRKDTHEPVIVDWRSPVANLYYEGQLGKALYESEGDTYTGELLTKRQYLIEEGFLQEIRDIDITAIDEMLQEALTTNAEQRLKDIVSTIQSEQNKIIRAQMNKPLIVQGVAGSGKTTIAMHRIAYFIYTYANKFQPNEMMILAPSRLFLHYISEVLPELGVEDVKQTTFIDFFTELMGKKFKFTQHNQKLLQFVGDEQGKSDDTLRWLSSFKGSLLFKRMVKQFAYEIEITLVAPEDVTLERFVLLKGTRVKELYEKQYAYLPPFQRIEKIKKVIQEHLKQKKKEILEKVEEVYDTRIDKIRYGTRDQEERRKKVVSVFDRKEAHMKELQKLSKTVVKDYIKKFVKRDAFDYYKQLMSDPELLVRLSKDELSQSQAETLSNYSMDILKANLIELEDAAAVLYLKHLLFGIKVTDRVKTIIIDEAQDYSLFQFGALKEILHTELFTILGDLSQGIHGYRGINDWNDLIEGVFTKATYTEMTQSYRTTIEIMNEANQVILHSKSKSITLAQPVVRHGEAPKYYHVNTAEELGIQLDSEVNRLRSNKMKSIAIIGKTKKECEKLRKLLTKHTEIEHHLLEESGEMSGNGIVIVPSYLVKGLEFDAVIIVTVEEVFDMDSELDVKLLYVSMTRPLHDLTVIHKNEGIVNKQRA